MISRLATDGHTVCVIAEDADVSAVAIDLAALRIRAARRRAPDAGEIARVRAKHGLSQREFADRLGIDLDTLRNWEQGRNKPDSTALSLVRIFDRAPEFVLDAVFEPLDP